MFTGIIEEVGKIDKLDRSGELRRLNVKCKQIPQDIMLGASVCCNGICLTVASFDENSITVATMPQTLKKTTVSEWGRGTLINLERSLTLQSRLDGHLVQGHVDTATTLKRIDVRNKTALLTFKLPKEFYHLIVEQGSIAVNGVSLTVSSLRDNFFSVSLVEFTLQHTNLGRLKPGNRVNLEFDVIGKYIYRSIQAREKMFSEERLDEIGF